MSKRKLTDTASLVKQSVKESGAEASFLKETGLSTLDGFGPQTEEKKDASSTAVVMKPTPSAAPKPPPELKEDDFAPKTKLDVKSPLSMFYGFVGTRINYPVRVHCLNSIMVDNFYFKRAAPDYHPYILRLYFGVLFWIQCLRAGNDVAALSDHNHQFLLKFLSAHPLETLAIPGPLMALFKTLCSSQPEFQNYGKVYPRLPVRAGPNPRSNFILPAVENHLMPNVPGIFALLEHLNGLINADLPTYPRKGRHTPVTEGAVAAIVFGHHSFPPLAERSELESWSLVSPGLQYKCEADQRLNEAFSERYDDFDFPPTRADDDIRKLSKFLGMNKSMAWFTQVKEVAAVAATFFHESGTLADCAPSGLVANQIVCQITPPDGLLPDPTHSADKRSLFPFSYRLMSTARNLPPLAETAAAYAQTHIRMYNMHPYYSDFGIKDERSGPFWSIRPIESSSNDETSYLKINPMIRRMLKSKGPS